MDLCEVSAGFVKLTSKREQRLKAKKSRTLKRNIAVLATIVVVVIALIVVYRMGGGPSQGPSASGTKVLLVTSMGNITIELYEDMPITSENFKNLTQRRIYDNTIFHRVVHDFVVQGGDPTGTGQGDPSIASIPDELPNKHSNVAGSVAMAKSSLPNSASSQFYINLKDNSANLDSNYSVFGNVTAGMDVVYAIGNVQTDSNDRPLQDVTLISAELVS